MTAENCPVPIADVAEICSKTVASVLPAGTEYVHESTSDWNTSIINGILKELTTRAPDYKWLITSTIVQHQAGDKTSRGVHSSQGAWWNNERDGMWTYKYPGAESPLEGMDVILGIVWIGI